MPNLDNLVNGRYPFNKIKKKNILLYFSIMRYRKFAKWIFVNKLRAHSKIKMTVCCGNEYIRPGIVCSSNRWLHVYQYTPRRLLCDIGDISDNVNRLNKEDEIIRSNIVAYHFFIYLFIYFTYVLVYFY